MRILVFILALIFLTGEAQACRYTPRSFEESYAAANDVVIGTVEYAGDEFVLLVVEKVYKGEATAGGTLKIPTSQSSCHIHFVTGQKWLYLGASHPSGSLLLQDEKGYVLTENMPDLDKIPVTPPQTQTPELP